MTRRITFYPCGFPSWPAYADNYRKAEALMEMGVSFSTNQMCMLMDPRLPDYDVVEIVEPGRDTVTLVNGHDSYTWECDRTDRQLRHGNNVYKLWRAGEFE